MSSWPVTWNAVPEAERDFVPEAEEAHLLVDWLSLDEAVSKVFAGQLHNGRAAWASWPGMLPGRRGITASPADAPEGAMAL